MISKDFQIAATRAHHAFIITAGYFQLTYNGGRPHEDTVDHYEDLLLKARRNLKIIAGEEIEDFCFDDCHGEKASGIFQNQASDISASKRFQEQHDKIGLLLQVLDEAIPQDQDELKMCAVTAIIQIDDLIYMNRAYSRLEEKGPVDLSGGAIRIGFIPS